MANIYSLQLLRNGTPFTSYTAAVEAITSGTEQDGVLKLARYTSNESDSATTKYNTSTVKTIFGIRHSGAGGESGWTIFDSYHEVIQNIQDQIDSMTGGAGSIAQQIEAALNELDFGGVTGNVVTQVTQTDGLVAASGANVGNLALTDYSKGSDSGAVVATDSINAAISKLENQVDAVKAEKDAAIEALDYTDTAVTGSYVSAVDEADGVISVTRVALPSAGPFAEAGKPIVAVEETLGEVSASAGTINAEFVNVADADNNFTASTVEGALAELFSGYVAADQALKTEILGGASASADTLGELEALINNLEAGAATYTIRKDTSGLPETVKERYTLVETINGVSTDKQDVIDIPKDSHIVSITYNGTTQKLTYTYINDSGATASTDVDMSELVLETEFASGVGVTNHVAHGVVDPASETFLTVGENGFKLAGVQDAIDAAVSGASDELQDAIDELSGKAVTNVAMTGGTAAITANTADGTKMITINTDGSQILATGYAKGSDASAIAATDSINAALAKLENQVDAAKAAATVVEKDANASHITLSSTTGSNGETVYTIGENDIASKSDLDAEIAARKAVDGVDGDAYTADTNAHYINNASTLYGADQALDTALYTVSGKADAAQAEIDAIESAVGLSNSGAYVAGDGQYTSAATSVADAIDKLDDAVAANKIIAGDGIEITEAASGTTVAVDLKEDITTQGSEWENPLQFDADGKLYFNALDCGEYN